MLDFSNPPSTKASAAAGIPDGTLLVGEIHLPHLPYSNISEATYMVRDKFSPMVKFCYDFVVKLPAQYAGRTLSGSKPVTASMQRAFGVDIPGLEAETGKGDRAVRAILAFDAMARGIPANCQIETYDELEDRLAAVKIGMFQGRPCMQAFLDPMKDKDRPTCELLIQSLRSLPAQQPAQQPVAQPVAQQVQQPVAQPVAPAPQPTQAAPVSYAPWPNQQPWPAAQAAPAQVAPQPTTQLPNVRVVVQHPQQQMQMQQPANNGWPKPSDDDDIPF